MSVAFSIHPYAPHVMGCITNLRHCYNYFIVTIYRGILVHSYDANNNNSKVVYELNPNSFFIPASNKKLLTTAAALISHGQLKQQIVIEDNNWHFHTTL